MPGFWKTLKKWLGDAYDYLGLVLVSSFVWFGVTLGGLAVLTSIGLFKHPIALLAGAASLYVFLIAPVTAGVYVLARKMVTRDDPSVMDIVLGFREFLVASWALGFAQVLVTLAIAVNAWFYLSHGGIALKLLGVLAAYVLLLWALSATYHFPTMIEQRPGVLKILKRGFLLALDNLGFTCGVFFVIILLTCFCAVTLLGLPLLYLGLVSILHTRALRALFVKYEVLPPEREPVPEEGPGFRIG